MVGGPPRHLVLQVTNPGHDATIAARSDDGKLLIRRENKGIPVFAKSKKGILVSRLTLDCLRTDCAPNESQKPFPLFINVRITPVWA